MMSGLEIFVILFFMVFILWILLKPEVALKLQQKVYSYVGIEMNFSSRAKMFIRIFAVIALIILIYGLSQTL